MNRLARPALLAALVLVLAIRAAHGYTFNEELFVETLPDHHVGFRFEFTSIYDASNAPKGKVVDYDLFPKSIGDIVNEFKIKELKLSLSQGTWKYNKWGLPSMSVPTGGELWATFHDLDSKAQIDSYWLASSRTISGLFGLSINLIENPNTIQPKHSIVSANDSSATRFASVPNEIVCTENLTPWIKLLPCGKQRGLGKLFTNPYKLFEAHYVSTNLHYQKICLDSTDCSKYRMQLKHSLSLVYNLATISQDALSQKSGYVWSFSLLFGEKLNSFCPVADQSNIYIDLANMGLADVEPTRKIKVAELNKVVELYDLKHIFQVNKTKELNPIVAYRKATFSISPVITIHRYTTNMNERNFGIKSQIQNLHSSERLSVTYLETIPWYFKVLISTLVIKQNDTTVIKPDLIHFVPGLSYKSPHHIEIKFKLEPNSVYTVDFRAEYAYLKWDEYPPDVNHGFYINPVLLTISHSGTKILWPQLRHLEDYPSIEKRLASNVKDSVFKIYSEALLVNLPAPDFSMPYNVICLTCTVVAIAFGSIHNFTTRKFIFFESKSPLDKLKRLGQKILDRIRQ